jgi:hypothetical protein
MSCTDRSWTVGPGGGRHQVPDRPDGEEITRLGGREEIRDHPAVGAREEERVGGLPARELGEDRPALRQLVLPEVQDPANQLFHGRTR